jgi:hypothetical protein
MRLRDRRPAHHATDRKLRKLETAAEWPDRRPSRCLGRRVPGASPTTRPERRKGRVAAFSVLRRPLHPASPYSDGLWYHRGSGVRSASRLFASAEKANPTQAVLREQQPEPGNAAGVHADHPRLEGPRAITRLAGSWRRMHRSDPEAARRPWSAKARPVPERPGTSRRDRRRVRAEVRGPACHASTAVPPAGSAG